MDEVFGATNFVNQISWRRTGAHNDPQRFGTITDTIFFYSRSDRYLWNAQFSERSDDSIATSFSYAEKPDGTTMRLKKGQEPEKLGVSGGDRCGHQHPLAENARSLATKGAAKAQLEAAAPR